MLVYVNVLCDIVDFNLKVGEVSKWKGEVRNLTSRGIPVEISDLDLGNSGFLFPMESTISVACSPKYVSVLEGVKEVVSCVKSENFPEVMSLESVMVGAGDYKFKIRQFFWRCEHRKECAY